MSIAELIVSAVPRSTRLDTKRAIQAEKYLQAFGYLEGIKNPKKELTSRVKKAQRMLGVIDDGKIGEVTLKAMRMAPRCGVRDVVRQQKRINKWANSKFRNLTYFVNRFVTGLSESTQIALLEQAWQSWENVCGLKISRVNSPTADIIIDASASREEEFGEAGNVLAWAYLPQGSNHTRQLLMKFDLAETWIDDVTNRGILFLNVATHEFGHLAGLEHTTIRGELMYAMYDTFVNSPQIRFDIPQSVLRYGEPIIEPPPPPPPPPPPEDGPTVEGVIKINGYSYELQRVV